MHCNPVDPSKIVEICIDISWISHIYFCKWDKLDGSENTKSICLSTSIQMIDLMEMDLCDKCSRFDFAIKNCKYSSWIVPFSEHYQTVALTSKKHNFSFDALLVFRIFMFVDNGCVKLIMSILLIISLPTLFKFNNIFFLIYGSFENRWIRSSVS